MVEKSYQVVNDKDCEDPRNDGEIYKIHSAKTILPQVFAGITVCLFSMITGMALSFSGVLVPALESPYNEINVTENQISWMASVNSFTMMTGSIFAGILEEKFGRLTTIKISGIPSIIGWILIAKAPTIQVLLCGRALTGLGSAFVIITTGVYLGETTWPNVREVLMVVPCLTSSIGVAIVYLQGFVMHWRTVAWSCMFITIIAVFLCFHIPETPVWLIGKNKINKCRKSLMWFNKYHPECSILTETHLNVLKQERDSKSAKQSQMKGKNNCFEIFRKPAAIKAMLLGLGLIFIQQFSGIYVFMAFAINFFKSTGSDINPLIATNLITGIPVFVAMINVITLKYFDKKSILIVSCIGITICLYTSALFTKWIHEGIIPMVIQRTTDHKWVPVACLFIYMIMAILGLEPLPWVVATEVFPLENRGIISGIFMSVACCVMFIAIQSYRSLYQLFGSASSLQLFYGTISLLGVPFVYLLVPVTKGKALSEIEAYFK